MTREDIKKQFPDATEEQITAILNINGADLTEAKKKNVDPKVLKQLQEDSADYKKLQDANLTDAEKIQKALQEATDAKLDFAKKSNRLDVEKILVGAGLAEDDYKDLIDTLVSDDAEKSKAAATAFAKEDDVACLSSKIKNAIREVRSKRNYPEHFTEEQIEKDLKNLYSNIRELALYDYNQVGAEGQTSHNESGTNRAWKSRNDCFIGVFAFCG